MSDELILIEKNGEQIRIHPLCLSDHQRLGWQVVDEIPEPPAPKVLKPSLPVAVPEPEKVEEAEPEPKAEKPKRGRKS